MLCLIYSAVARRLGLEMTMIGLGNFCAVRYEGRDPPPLVDVYNAGKLLPVRPRGDVNDSKRIYTRILRNLINDLNDKGDKQNLMLALNQSLLIDVEEPMELGARIYLHITFTKRLDCALADLKTWSENGFSKALEQTYRKEVDKAQQIFDKQEIDLQSLCPKSSSNLEFFVGQIIRHRDIQFRGVIIGWDQKMNLSKKPMSQGDPNQPFYWVLIDITEGHGITKVYLPESCLDSVGGGKMIQHPKIGKYFQEFKSGYYVLNPKLRQKYSQ